MGSRPAGPSVAEVLADAELARAREGASYAGEPDPYRRPAEDDDEDPDLAATADDSADEGSVRHGSHA